LADVRKASGRSNRVDRTTAKKNGAARKKAKPRPKLYATLEDSDLRQLTSIYALVEQKQIELLSLQNHYKLAIEEIREKYEIEQKIFNIDFLTGKITETQLDVEVEEQE